MSNVETFPRSNALPEPLAWPVIGGKGLAFGNSLGAEADIQALQRIGVKSRIARNRTIFMRGDAAEYSYKVVSGVVRLCKHMADGRRHIAQFSFPGDFFSFMESGLHSFTAEAVTDVVVMCYPKREMENLNEERPSVRRRFLTLLSQRLCEMENHLTVLGRQTAKERVVSFVLFLAERIGLDEDDLVDVPMSRQDIADYLGLTIETVSRVLSECKRGGLLEIPNLRQIVLNDIGTLQALVDGEREFAPWERCAA